MAISSFPIGGGSASVSVPAITGSSVIATTANTYYVSNTAFAVGVYSITCTSSATATVDFYNGASLITSVSTTSGVVIVNLATAATKIEYKTAIANASNIYIYINQTSDSLVSTTFSGTLDTITSSTTYATTSANGYAYVVAVGAGGGGGAAGGYFGNANQAGGGGGSGGVASGYVALTGNVAVNIGAIGTFANNRGTPGNAGGATSFGALTANGGSGGGANQYTTPASGGGGGSPRGGQGGGYSGGPVAARPIYGFVKNGTTGGGAAFNGEAPGGSGIGTGGVGGTSANQSTGRGADGTGFGSGGGAGWSGSTSGQWGLGGNGAPGVVYVLR
jgi:hypothetical protein